MRPTIVARAIAASLAIVASAFGQNARLMEPSITERTLDQIAVRLALTEEERVAVAGIHAGWARAYRERALAVRALRAAADTAIEHHADDARELQGRWAQAWGELIVARREAEKSLLADLRAVLPSEGVGSRWPGVERWLRREALPIVQAPAVTGWHRLDLVACGEESGVLRGDASLAVIDRVRPGVNAPAIADAFERYELDVDRPLAERAAMWDEEMRWPEDKQERLGDDLQARNLGFGRRVAEAARTHHRWIESLLAPDEREAWRAAAWRVAYRDVERLPRPAADAIARAVALGDLTPTQRESLSGSAHRYGRRSAELDADARAAFDAADADALVFADRPPAEQVAALNARTDPASVVYLRLAAARQTFEQERSNELWAQLTPSQRERVESAK